MTPTDAGPARSGTLFGVIVGIMIGILIGVLVVPERQDTTGVARAGRTSRGVGAAEAAGAAGEVDAGIVDEGVAGGAGAQEGSGAPGAITSGGGGRGATAAGTGGPRAATGGGAPVVTPG